MSEAVDARQELDLRIGAAFTRFQTLRFQPRFHELDKKILSYGSCQFPTLGFVVEQYWNRERFVPEDFWKISVTLTKDRMNVQFSWDRGVLFDQLCCLVLYERCIDNPIATVTSVSSRPTKKWRPLPLTTVELQKFGSRRLRIDSHRIMVIAEELYNKGYISYPRTETNEFEQGFNLNALIQKQVGSPQWGDYAQRLLNGEFKWPRKGNQNDKAHPPIHPTNFINDLQGDQKKVYEFITRCFLACCSDDAHGLQTNVAIKIDDQGFHASGLQVTARNYLDVYTYDRWSDTIMPEFRQGERIQPSACEMHNGRTSPPGLLTEADLIATMDRNGIGTDATIAEHIKKIQDREYVFKDNQVFVPSTLGLALVEGYDEIAFETSLAKPHLRRQMEQLMKDVCQARRTKASIVDESLRLYSEMFQKANRMVHKLDRSMAKHLGHEPDGHQNLPGGNNRRDDGDDNPPAPPRRRRNQSPPARAPRNNRRGDDHDDDNGNGNNAPPGVFQAQPQRQQARNQPPVDRTQQSQTQSGPPCECRNPSVERTVTKENDNKGRRFFVCASRTCDFFQWADAPPTGQSQVSMPSLTRSTASSSYTNYASQQPGYNNASSYRQHNAFQGSLNVGTKPMCQCDLHAKLCTTTKEGPNKGRQFWTCTKTARKCGFFHWVDENSGENRTLVAGGTSGYGSGLAGSSSQNLACFKCGQPGHFANACTQSQYQSVQQSMSSSRGRGSGGGGFDKSSMTCYKCGQTGHFASECQGSYTSQTNHSKSRYGSGSRSNQPKRTRYN